jgi:hypothetical protein
VRVFDQAGAIEFGFGPREHGLGDLFQAGIDRPDKGHPVHQAFGVADD